VVFELVSKISELETVPSHLIYIPTLYGYDVGPDLPIVAKKTF
jgi:allophanate hydrolase subunit 1